MLFAALQNKMLRAFSLIELIIVMAIIGILSTISFPVYNDYIIKAKITKIFNFTEVYKLTVVENIFDGNFLDEIYTDLDETINCLRVFGNNPFYIEVEAKMTPNFILRWIAKNTNGQLHWSCEVHANFSKYIPYSCIEVDIIKPICFD